MLPAWTDAGSTPAAPIVTTAEARNWVGLYGDSSLDDELAICLAAAVEKVSAFCGFRVVDTIISDYWKRPGGLRLTLSEPGIDATSVEVLYRDLAGEEVEAGFSLDPTAERNTVVLRELPAMSGDFEHPLRVRYTSKLAAVRGAPAAGRIKSAIRMVTSRLWQGRGELPDPALTDRALTGLLGSVRLDPPVSA